MHVVVAQKNTVSGAKLELMGIIWTQIWPTRAPEHSKTRVVQECAKKLMDGCIIGEKLYGGTIYEICSS
jgi:hypothetical protein